MRDKVKYILEKARQELSLTEEEILTLLKITEKDELQELYKTARMLRERYFKNKVFYYGFVYFSTYCRNHCNFCYFRKENTQLSRYRKTTEEILETVKQLKESGVHLIDLTMGEDPYFHQNKTALVELVKEVKRVSDLPVMISPGVVEDGMILALQEAGADWYALYQETHSRELFANLRKDQDYDRRFAAKLQAKKAGMLVEEGMLIGVGENENDILHSLQEMGSIGADQIRNMTFVPQKGTPMEDHTENTYLAEIRNIAIMRILYPDCLIPASLDVEGRKGLQSRLLAGANVITSIIPPQSGMAGVAQADYDIENGHRTVSGIQDILKECGMEGATAKEYQLWIEQRKSK